METKVTTTHLQMLSPDLLRRGETNHNFTVSQMGAPNPALNHFFFVNVGIPFRWYSRLTWSRDDWRRWVDREEVFTHVGFLDGTPVGYFELERQNNLRDVEIVFLGVLSDFLGRGLGGALLTACIEAAWSLHPERVWLHTCSEDHPHALDNYLARGFSVFREETKMEAIPDADDPIWCTPAYYRSLQK